MMFESNGVHQNRARNRQTRLLQLVILLDCRLCARVCAQEFVNLVCQIRILDQAMIFRICKLFCRFQLGHCTCGEYQPEFFRSLFGIELKPTLLGNFNSFIPGQIRQALVGGG
jgi:hypothetical protein